MTTYSTGTLSVGAGSTSVTGVGTSWASSGIRAGDILIAAGNAVPIAVVGGNVALTLARPWPGAALSGANYDVLLIDDNVRTLVAANMLMQSLSNGTLTSLAGLASAANKLPYFSGANTMALADLTSQMRGLMSGTALSRSGDTYTLNGLLAGTAVTGNAADTTAGRLARVHANGGIFGWGNVGTTPFAADLDSVSTPSGLWRVGGEPNTIGTRPAGFPTGGFGQLLVLSDSASNMTQLLVRNAGTLSSVWVRKYVVGTTSWTAWQQIYSPENILGTVSQSAGAPTGAIIERGSNANGDYVRFADGTQMCWTSNLNWGDSAAAGSGTMADPYRTAASSWVFPAAFSVTSPIVTGSVRGDSSGVVRHHTLSNRYTTATGISQAHAIRSTSVATSMTPMVDLVAVGRWF